MVWTGVTADRRTDLVVVPGILTGQRYIDEILSPHVVPFLRPLGNNGIFQDDNARPHRTRIVDGFLQANNVMCLEWPAMSPDLSCIEHVWDVLGRAVQKRMTEHSTMADLRHFLGEDWQRIPQATIRKLVLSTWKRLIESRQRQSGWLYSLLSQGADQRWNKVWQVKMNSQCQNVEIKLLIFLFCLSVVSLLRIAAQWNSVVSTWRFSFILMQRSRDDVFHVWGLLVGDISFVTICTFWKVTLITLNSLWNNFIHVLMIEICSVLSGSGCWRMWYTIYENRPHRRPLFAMVHYFFDRVYNKGGCHVQAVSHSLLISWSSTVVSKQVRTPFGLLVRKQRCACRWWLVRWFPIGNFLHLIACHDSREWNNLNDLP